MTDEQILECAKVVYDFLCDVSGNKFYFSRYNMVDFCQFVNDKYNFYENPLWVKTGQEFFSDDFSQPGPSKAKLMLKSLIRDQKINEILCQNM
jgi:hypothetical protein